MTLRIFQYTSAIDPRAPEGGEAHSPRHRHPDGRPLRHRPAARRPVHLPVIARLGSWDCGTGTLAPLALGLTIGAYAGRSDARRLLKALEDHCFTNIPLPPPTIA
jgi:acetyl-CoA synthetase